MSPWRGPSYTSDWNLINSEWDSELCSLIFLDIFPQRKSDGVTSVIQSKAHDRSHSLVAPQWQPLSLFPLILPPTFHKLPQNIREMMTSPRQAVIFKSVGEGDLPFTSPLAEDSPTFLPFVFLQKKWIKTGKWGKAKETKAKYSSKSIFYSARPGSPSFDLWPWEP